MEGIVLTERAQNLFYVHSADARLETAVCRTICRPNSRSTDLVLLLSFALRPGEISLGLAQPPFLFSRFFPLYICSAFFRLTGLTALCYLWLCRSRNVSTFSSAPLTGLHASLSLSALARQSAFTVRARSTCTFNFQPSGTLCCKTSIFRSDNFTHVSVGRRWPQASARCKIIDPLCTSLTTG